MGISDNQLNLAEVEVSGISAMSGIGMSRVQFSLELSMTATPNYSARISNPVCFVWAGRTQSEGLLPLGNAIPETCWFADTGEYSKKDRFLVILDLPGEQTAALERMRAGGPLFFRLDLHVSIDGKHGRQRSFEQIWFEATSSEWSKVLKSLGHLELLLLSVELPIADIPKELAAAIKQTQDAHADLIAGRYNSVVRSVRLALDSVDAVIKNASAESAALQAFSGNRNAREAMSKGQRSDLVRAAIRHFTHLAHHVDSSGNTQDFGRHDATFILSAAASVIWDVIGTMRLNEEAG